MATTTKRAATWVSQSRRARPSQKQRKQPVSGVFGASTQFKGIGRGAKGDPRR